MSDKTIENIQAIKDLMRYGHGYDSYGLRVKLREAFANPEVSIEQLVSFLRACMKKAVSAEDIKTCMIQKTENYLATKNEKSKLLFPKRSEERIKKKLEKLNTGHTPKF